MFSVNRNRNGKFSRDQHVPLFKALHDISLRDTVTVSIIVHELLKNNDMYCTHMKYKVNEM